MTDGDDLYCAEHQVLCRIVESICCISETNTTLLIIQLKKKKSTTGTDSCPEANSHSLLAHENMATVQYVWERKVFLKNGAGLVG